MRPLSLRIGALILVPFVFLTSGCDSSDDPVRSDAIVVGANLELTGSLPVVGQSSRRAADLFVAARNREGGLTLGSDAHRWVLDVRDNEDDVDAAVAATRALIEDGALAVVGPNISTLAISAGAAAEAQETPLVTPWATSPDISAGRDWVFNAAFVDSYQGPVLAAFASEQYADATDACVIYDRDEAYSSGIASAFQAAWEEQHGAGSVVAEESFADGETDFSAQFGRLRDAGCDVLFAPVFTDDVIRVVAGATIYEVTAPILGSDSWVSAGLLEQCGAACEGIFVAAHYVPDGATGTTQAFIEAYEAEYGETPDDIAALTWDALLVVEQGLKNCGELSGDLDDDRMCLRDGIAAIRNLDAVTGAISYSDGGAPAKCAVIGQVQSGTFVAVDSVCP